MKIKRSGENKYIALNDAGDRIGFCAVSRRELERIFPDAPTQYVIRVKCDDECRDLLYGAAVTRARLIALRHTEPCRIFAELEPGDTKGLEVIRALGFGGNDGVNRMVRRVTDERVENEEERKKCLRRYNECFGADYDMAWLKKLSQKRDFARILMVSPTELCGELMVWSQGYTGVIGILQVARAWRRKGVGSYLVEDARKYFASIGLKDMTFDVWLSSPGCLPLAKKCGFRRGEMVKLYPKLER